MTLADARTWNTVYQMHCVSQRRGHTRKGSDGQPGALSDGLALATPRPASQTSGTRRSGHRIVGGFWDFGGMLRHRQHQRTVDAQHALRSYTSTKSSSTVVDTATGMENSWRCAAMAGGPNRLSLLSSPGNIALGDAATEVERW